MLKKTKYLFISITLLAAFACSESSTDSEIPGKGSGSFTISGDIEGEKTGIANFRAFEMSGVHTWDILIHDQSPMTYDMSFLLFSDEPVERPDTGMYELVVGNFDGTEFSGTFSDYRENPSNPDGYLVGISGSSGSLTITSSSENLVEGTFQFTAANAESEGSITVSDGEFSAVPRISPN